MTSPTIVALGGKRVLIHGQKVDGIYRIGFTQSATPLLTEEEVQGCEPNPSVILEFHDREAIAILLTVVKKMHDHSREPTWRIAFRTTDGIRTDDYADDYE